MAVREILEIGHPTLAARAREVEVDAIGAPEVQGWVDDLIDTMRAANGAGMRKAESQLLAAAFIPSTSTNHLWVSELITCTTYHE